MRRIGWLLALCVPLCLTGGAVSQTVAVGDPAFAIIERLPEVESSGPNEFAPLAVGSTHLLLVGATHITLYRKSTASEPARQVANVPVRTFFGESGGPVDRLTDPDALFDPASGRFFFVFGDTTRTRLQLVLAVSTSSTPETLTSRDWHVFRLERNDSGVDHSDFDHLAIAGDKLLISWQRTGTSPTGPVGLGTTIRVFDKRPFIDGIVPTTTPVDLVLPSTRNLRARPARVSAAGDRATDRVFYDISSQCGSGNRRSWTIGVVSGLPEAPALTTREAVSPLPCVGNALTIPQPGNAAGMRFRRLAANPAYFDGRVWLFEWGDGSAPGTTSGIEWVEVDVRGWPDTVAVLQAGVHREPEAWLFAPAGIVDWGGNLVLTYARSGLSEYPSAAVAGRLATDPSGTTRQGDTLKQSQRAWEDTDPMAAVLGAAIDPVDGSVWVTGMTPVAVRRPGPKDSVATWIGRLRPGL